MVHVDIFCVMLSGLFSMLSNKNVKEVDGEPLGMWLARGKKKERGEKYTVRCF